MIPAIYKQKSCSITDRKSTGHCDRYRECSTHDLRWTEQKSVPGWVPEHGRKHSVCETPLREFLFEPGVPIGPDVFVEKIQ